MPSREMIYYSDPNETLVGGVQAYYSIKPPFGRMVQKMVASSLKDRELLGFDFDEDESEEQVQKSELTPRCGLSTSPLGKLNICMILF